jgi:hypothetical protein
MPTFIRSSPAVPIAAFAVALHLYASGQYGYFRDELYFIICGQHPDWGYVDQPPLVPLLAAAMQALVPGSLRVLRLVPALSHGATIILAGETARLLGGGRFAQALTALCVLAAGVFLAIGTILTTDVVQPLTWLACTYGLIRLIRGADQRWFLALGAVAGVGLLTKYMLAFWLVALLLGLLATPQRRLLARPWCWLGVALAAAITAPNVAWQAVHGFPFLELGQTTALHKNVALSPARFLLAEADMLGGPTAIVWVTGLIAFTAWRRFADLRCFALGYVVLIGTMVVLHGKPYYPAGAYPLLFAGGAVALEAWIARRAIRSVLVAVILAFGVLAAPFALPILPIEQFAAWQDRLGVTPRSMDREPIGRLPQYYADMFGWPELAALVGKAYAALSPEDQARAVFLGNNYGVTSAIAFFGPAWHLPPAISGHNNFYLWGPLGHDGSVLIRLGGSREGLLKAYASVEAAGVFQAQWAMPYEIGHTLWVCRGRRVPLQEAWPTFRHYD